MGKLTTVSGRQRFAAIVALLVLGLSMVALADVLSEYWPLFLTPLPYGAIPWLVVHAADGSPPEPVRSGS
jgi:hypothetical protein